MQGRSELVSPCCISQVSGVGRSALAQMSFPAGRRGGVLTQLASSDKASGW